ncbi:hypothetical protein NSMM_310023 [Nitrosomonas mobilis]|uniref:Uncharacterized protein n=1 Tax=Nitrosomonas mobilis TaxID=51642 RepID=A0A1G5SEG7_9PROT|nr:hypothetical protein NSMM_310023 [Nitrosomonas mobilis]
MLMLLGAGAVMNTHGKSTVVFH